MIGKLKDGFEVEIKEESLNSWEFLEMLSDIDDGNAGLIVKVARMFLGDDLEKLKDHIRKDGKIPADAMIGALSELMESAQEPKNS